VPRSKNEWSFTSTPNTPSWRGAQSKHRDFTIKKIIIITITTQQYISLQQMTIHRKHLTRNKRIHA
jgi:hypothetical protein